MTKSKRSGAGRAGRPRPTGGEAPRYINDPLQYEMEHFLRYGGSEKTRSALRSSVIDAAEKATEALPAAYAELHALIAASDPIRLYGAIDIYDAMRRSMMPGDANFGSDAMVELLGGFVASSTEIELLDRIGGTFSPAHLQDTDQLLQRIANLRFQSGRGSTFDDVVESRSRVLSLLKLEHDFDRMAGFDKYVRQIAAEIFGRVDDRVLQGLGFSLAGTLQFADLYNRVRSQHARHADEEMRAFFPPLPRDATPAQQQSWALREIISWAVTAAAPLEGTEFDDVLAEQLGIDPAAFRKLVAAMSTRIGSVSATEALQDNPVRIRPIISLSSGEWMWPRPVDFVHGALEWGYSVVQNNAKLAKAYDKARQNATEDLTEGALRAIFGGHVHRSVRYPTDESDAEVDILITIPGAVIVVECKGGRFSRAGRRAAPRRVDRHVQDIVERANEQNARTERAIRSGLPFTDSDGRPLQVDPAVDVLPITVTLDRMDPFSAYLGFAEAHDATQRSWIINLADLLLISEILPSPSEFIAYLLRRRELLTDEVTVFVEADALGAWCEDRLTSIRTLRNADGDVIARMVSETSDWMNNYFTAESTANLFTDDETSSHDLHHSVEKPSTRMPAHVVATLDEMLERGDESWFTTSASALSVTPRAWKVVERLLAAVEAQGARPLGRTKTKQLRRATGGLCIDNRVVVEITRDPAGQPRLLIRAAQESP